MDVKQFVETLDGYLKAERLEDLVNEFFDITRFRLSQFGAGTAEGRSKTHVGAGLQ